MTPHVKIWVRKFTHKNTDDSFVECVKKCGVVLQIVSTPTSVVAVTSRDAAQLALDYAQTSCVINFMSFQVTIIIRVVLCR